MYNYGPYNHSPIEIANLESAIAGVLAGFAVTIVVLLLERLSNPKDDAYQNDLDKAAILVFVGVFVTATLASFLYAVTAGEADLHPRLFLSMLMPAFTFSLSSVLIALGLVFLFYSYKLEFALNAVQLVLFGTIFVAVFNYSSAVLDAMAVMQQTTVSLLFKNAQISVPIIAMPILSFTVGLLGRQRYQKKTFDLKFLGNFIYFVIILVLLIGCLAPLIHQSPTNVTVPHAALFTSILLLNLVCGWAIMSIPNVPIPN